MKKQEIWNNKFQLARPNQWYIHLNKLFVETLFSLTPDQNSYLHEHWILLHDQGRTIEGQTIYLMN